MSDRIHDPADVAEIKRLKAEVAEMCLRYECEKDTLRMARTTINGMRDQHARDSAELRRLCAERDDYRRRWSDSESNLAFCDSDLQTLEIELAALRKRIEDAPKGECRCTLGKCELRDVDAAALSLYGKRVALVVMEDE